MQEYKPNPYNYVGERVKEEILIKSTDVQACQVSYCYKLTFTSQYP